MFHLVAEDAGLLTVNGTLIAEIIAFVLMILILAKWVYPPVMRAAESREKQIEDGIKAAQESEKRLADVKAEVEKILDDARQQAREIMDRARKEASADAEDARNKGRRDAQAIADKARSDIEAERDRALQELRTQVGALVVAAAGKVLGQAIDERAHQRLIEESLARITPETGGRG